MKCFDRIVFLNTTIMTCNGEFSVFEASHEEVMDILRTFSHFERLSAIGHESTAQIMSELLKEDVCVNRIQYEQREEDICIVMKLRGRAPEGVILTREEIEAIGYDLKIMTCDQKFNGKISDERLCSLKMKFESLSQQKKYVVSECIQIMEKNNG